MHAGERKLGPWEMEWPKDFCGDRTAWKNKLLRRREPDAAPAHFWRARTNRTGSDEAQVTGVAFRDEQGRNIGALPAGALQVRATDFWGGGQNPSPPAGDAPLQVRGNWRLQGGAG